MLRERTSYKRQQRETRRPARDGIGSPVVGAQAQRLESPANDELAVAMMKPKRLPQCSRWVISGSASRRHHCFSRGPEESQLDYHHGLSEHIETVREHGLAVIPCRNLIHEDRFGHAVEQAVIQHEQARSGFYCETSKLARGRMRSPMIGWLTPAAKATSPAGPQALNCRCRRHHIVVARSERSCVWSLCKCVRNTQQICVGYSEGRSYLYRAIAAFRTAPRQRRTDTLRPCASPRCWILRGAHRVPASRCHAPPPGSHGTILPQRDRRAVRQPRSARIRRTVPQTGDCRPTGLRQPRSTREEFDTSVRASLPGPHILAQQIADEERVDNHGARV